MTCIKHCLQISPNKGNAVVWNLEEYKGVLYNVPTKQQLKLAKLIDKLENNIFEKKPSGTLHAFGESDSTNPGPKETMLSYLQQHGIDINCPSNTETLPTDKELQVLLNKVIQLCCTNGAKWYPNAISNRSCFNKHEDNFMNLKRCKSYIQASKESVLGVLTSSIQLGVFSTCSAFHVEVTIALAENICTTV